MFWVKKAEYVISCPNLSCCPKDAKPEIAFIGRSNVGKSSLINYIGGRPIAKTSATPGKTRLLNYFLINERFYLVDMPGYGYARVAITERKQFQQLTEDYLRKRNTLHLLFVLIDASLPPQKIDLHFLENIRKIKVPFAIIFTKIDKLRKSIQLQHITQLRKAFSLSKDDLWVVCSVHKKIGYTELITLIKEHLPYNT